MSLPSLFDLSFLSFPNLLFLLCGLFFPLLLCPLLCLLVVFPFFFRSLSLPGIYSPSNWDFQFYLAPSFPHHLVPSYPLCPFFSYGLTLSLSHPSETGRPKERKKGGYGKVFVPLCGSPPSLLWRWWVGEILPLTAYHQDLHKQKLRSRCGSHQPHGYWTRLSHPPMGMVGGWNTAPNCLPPRSPQAKAAF